MKKSILIFISLFTILSIYAQSFKITWNLGSFDIVWNHMDQDDEGVYHSDDIFLTLADFQFIFFDNLFSINTSFVQFKGDGDDGLYTFFPVELGLNVFQTKNFFIGPYVKGELNFNETKFLPYAEAGIKMGTHVKYPYKISNYSWRCSVYANYNTLNSINIGTQFDLGIIGIFFLWASLQEEN